MRSFRLAVAAAFTFLSSVVARSSTGDRVLVVLEPQVVKDEYSNFWASLKGRGYELTFKGPKDESAELLQHGERRYDHLILFAPSSKSFANSLSPQSIIDAQFAGINTLYLLSPNISELHRETLREYDIEFVEPKTVFLDAFSHVPSASAATVLLPPTSAVVPNGAILSPTTLSGGPIVYPSGTVHSLGLNPYLIDVLHGSKTGYVGEDKALSSDEAEVEATLGKSSKEAVLTGKKAALVSAFQSRDNVRAGFVGSGQMFSDKWWNTPVETSSGKTVTTGNANFAEDFTKWIFQETGVVKVVGVHHHRQGETEPRELYTKKDELTYTITLAQHTTTSNGTSSWTAFSAPDLQLDFTMLDPHYRKALLEDGSSSSSAATTYTTSFIAPDRHGVFKFVVEYWRPGWSYIRSSSTASVVPLRHDEHPRFITGAWPFYISTISVSIAFLLFCGLWVSLGESDKKGKKKAE